MPKEEKEKGLIATLYGIFAFLLPFFVHTNYPVDLLEKNGFINSSAYSADTKTLISALLIAFPYAFLSWVGYKVFFGLRPRLTMPRRIEQFDKDVLNVVDYKSTRDYYEASSRYFESLDKSEVYSPYFISLLDESAELLINILVSDLSLAFQGLVGHQSIRVSIYMSRSDVNPPVLFKSYTSEPSDRKEKSLQFPIWRGTSDIHWRNSYCGLAERNQRAVSGTAYPFPFPIKYLFKDRRFHEGSTLDERKSFLCVPITKKINEVEKSVAVIAIDSLRKYDFVLSKRLRRIIEESLVPVKTKLEEYIDLVLAAKKHEAASKKFAPSPSSR